MKLGLTVKVSLLPETPKKKKISARTLQSQWNFPKEKKKYEVVGLLLLHHWEQNKHAWLQDDFLKKTVYLPHSLYPYLKT